MKNTNPNPVVLARQRENSHQATEMSVWMMASLVIAAGILFETIFGKATVFQVISARNIELLTAFVTLLFPLVFRLIFGALPLESFRRYRAQRRLEMTGRPAEATSDNIDTREAQLFLLADSMSTDELASSPVTALFAYYATNSRRLSQSIYRRAGVYLLVGVLVAFSGLGFFYLQTAQTAALAGEGMSLLIALAPKFGILFFIEFVAFFFLRQYRSAMEEFRYYEAIKRKREETLALIRIGADSGQPFDPIDLVKSGSFFSTPAVLGKGQSTETIESKRLDRGELEVLGKLVDAFSGNKK